MRRFIRNLETRDKIILGVLAAVVIAMIVAFIILFVRKKNREAQPPDDSVVAEVDDKSYTLYLDTVKGVTYYYTMQYEQGLADDGRQFLMVPAGGRVTFEIFLEDSGKEITDVSIKYGWNRDVDYTITDQVVEFEMPSADVEVRPEIEDIKIAEITPTEIPEKIISVDGVTDSIREATQSRYDEETFLRSLKNALSLDTGNSGSYGDVSSITFTGEVVPNGNVISMVAVLNHNTSRKVLVQYHLDSGEYLFTLNYVPTPTPTTTPTPTQMSTKAPTVTSAPRQSQSNTAGGSSSGGSSSQATVPQAPQVTRPQTTTTTTTFSLSGITPEFQSAVGNAQEFLDILYDYLYSVYPDVTAGDLNGFGKSGQTVSFRITLNNGIVINGKYNTSNKTLDI